MSFVYIFKLTDDCYYISNNNDLRKEVNRTDWLKLHTPIECEEKVILSSSDIFAITLKYIAAHSVDKVRGSIFPDKLSAEECEFLAKMYRNFKDRCSRCGKSGHYNLLCSEEQSISGNYLRCRLCHGPHSCKECPRLGNFKLVP